MVFRFKKLFQLFLGLDLVVVVLHLIFSPWYDWFNLDFEQNLPTTYQAVKLFVLGVAALVFWLSRRHSAALQRLRAFLLPLGAILIFISIDELFQIHENIYRIFEYIEWFHPARVVAGSQSLGFRSSLWLLYYMPFFMVGFLWLGYWLKYFQERHPPVLRFMVVSGFLFLLVISAELLSSTGSFSHHTYFWMITVEEAAELAGASCVAGLLGELQREI